MKPKAGARSFMLVFHVSDGAQALRLPFAAFPRPTSREPDLKHSDWDFNLWDASVKSTGFATTPTTPAPGSILFIQIFYSVKSRQFQSPSGQISWDSFLLPKTMYAFSLCLEHSLELPIGSFSQFSLRWVVLAPPSPRFRC